MNRDELIESNIKQNKIDHEVEEELEKESDHICMICNKKVSSFCKSHSVPNNIFNHMNLDGNEVIPYYNALREKILVKIHKGKKNSGIFKLICRECDDDYFFKLDNFDVINGKWDNTLLRLQAQRILLFHIYRLKQFSYSLYKMFPNILSNKAIEKTKKHVNNQIKCYKKLFKKYQKNTEEKFTIVFDEVLDYETNFTTVSLIPIVFSPCLDYMIIDKVSNKTTFKSIDFGDGNIFTTISLDKKTNNDIYVLVFPYDGKTRVTVFCDKNSIFKLLSDIEFDNMPVDYKLLYISTSLIKFGRNIYGNDKFKQEIRKAFEISRQRFFKKRQKGLNVLGISTFELKEDYIYIYDNNINLFNK